MERVHRSLDPRLGPHLDRDDSCCRCCFRRKAEGNCFSEILCVQSFVRNRLGPRSCDGDHIAPERLAIKTAVSRSTKEAIGYSLSKERDDRRRLPIE